jgi:hypothetical protein
MDALVVTLAAVAYGCFYAAAPGRQRPAPTPARAMLLRVTGGLVGVGSLGLAGVTVGWGVGGVLWASALLTAGTLLVVGWPLVDPAVRTRQAPGTGRRGPSAPPPGSGSEAGP